MKNQPLVSVVMSVYNGEAYVGESIESILNQTYRNFEFIIIIDGPTDGTAKIVEKYAKKDSRIVTISQENKGLVSSLNSGVQLSKGQYIARIDSDDIAQPERLKLQLEYLEQHQDVSLVASTVRLIDDGGRYLGVWPTDVETITPEQIRHTMIEEACISHPTIMARAEVMKKYSYHAIQVAGEDYDLWLRLLSAGHKIAKIDKPLVLYRIHSESITQVSNQKSATLKLLRIKSMFVIGQLFSAHFGRVEREVLRTVLRKLLGILKAKIKALVKLPIQLISNFRAKSRLSSSQWPGELTLEMDKKRILLILPWLTLGGADKVIVDIVNNLDPKKYQVFLITTNNDHENIWIDQVIDRLAEHADVSGYGRKLIPQVIARYAEARQIDTVLVSSTQAGYESLSGLKALSVQPKIIDLLHGQSGWLDNGGAPKYSQPYEHFIDRRIVVTHYLQEYMERVYKTDSKKIKVIHNGVDLDYFNATASAHSNSAKKVLWVGRFSYEKRPELFVEAAKRVLEQDNKQNYEFAMAGDGALLDGVRKQIKDYGLSKKITILGRVDDMRSLLKGVDLVVMTSEMEGLPIALLEAQSMGIPVVSTGVGGIPEIIAPDTGILIDPLVSDIEQAFSDAIIEVFESSQKHEKMKLASRANAVKNFSLKGMIEDYEQIL